MIKIISMLLVVSMGLFAPIASATEIIRIIVPWGAGGVVDRTARELQKILNENTNYKFIVENRAGASGRIGTTHVAHQNGKETVLMAQAGVAMIANSLAKDSTYKMSDFVPVVYIGNTPFVLVAHKDNHVNSIEKLLALDSQEPVFFSSAGVKSGTHLAGETLKIATNKNLIHVPMSGEASAMVEVVANRVSFSFSSVATVKGHEDKLVILAAAQSTRIKQLPNVPTLKEKGFNGFEYSPVWAALYANPTADQNVIKEIQKVLVRELARPEVRNTFEQIGTVVSVDDILKLERISAAEEKRIQKVLEKAGLE
jgi:tripartite-type tricarboxylate transporter receptor subunit TctC